MLQKQVEKCEDILSAKSDAKEALVKEVRKHLRFFPCDGGIVQTLPDCIKSYTSEP